MKNRHYQAVLRVSICLFSASVQAYGQGSVGNGTFQNLDFESATIPSGTPPGSVSASSGFPDWSAYIGTSAQSQINLDLLTLDTSAIGVLDKTHGALDGNYSVVLQGGDSSFSQTASISQTGVIPTGANSLRFVTPVFESFFSVSINGQSIPISLLPGGTYGGNISQFAGKTANLEFTSSPFPLGTTQNFYLDDITFSGQVIPEPSSLMLLAFGCGLVAFHRLDSNKQSVRAMPATKRRQPQW
jgi:hypothetical protein